MLEEGHVQGMTEKEKMIRGDLYDARDTELAEGRRRAQEICQRYNTQPDRALLLELLGTCPDEVTIEAHFKCDYGENIHLGEKFYANFDLTILDVCKVTIGDSCLIGPKVGIYTATHPLDAELRRSGVEFGSPITIGNDCWIGGHAVINPGVTLGDNVVVASGAVVTKSFGDGVVIGGVPAQVLKRNSGSNFPAP
ncbi:MAG: maltose O-acetyltransferase [Akkermansiaceae bacterium]